MRPVAYVSDENYLALHDVVLEFRRADGDTLAVVRSSSSGAVYADLPDGEYVVTLAKSGFGSKRATAQIKAGEPVQFRLLSDALYGHAWPKWVKSGGTGEFRVHAPEPYHLSLWRYGIEKERVRDLGWFDEHGPRPNLQIIPDADFTQNGVGWNRQGYAPGAQQVAAPDRSGLYYFHARTASGAMFGFPWVVAPASPTAAVAVVASTNTWNAYNNFGGRSNYINPTGLPPAPTVNARQDLGRYVSGDIVWRGRNDEYRPLSFDRPEPFNHIPFDTRPNDPIRGRQACHLAEAEWRLLAWLEREGIAYDLYSDHQLHAGELDLDAYRALVISTHPEYWSRGAFARVKTWVGDRGGKLMYLGGNGIDCEVAFAEGGSAMRCKSWLPGPRGTLKFVEPESGRAYDCRFHYTTGESPAGLLGVVFTEAGAMTGAPYRVTDASHWAFAGTGLADGATFGEASLHERCPGGASGHETDKVTPLSPPNIVTIARGLNAGDGGAEMTFYETPSGGAVFSAGSITWPASVLVDGHVSRITRNMLERFTRA